MKESLQRIEFNATPTRFWVREGEIFGHLKRPIVWPSFWDWNIEKVCWKDDVNPAGQPGVDTDQGHGYAGWDEEYQVYLRYKDEPLRTQEHCVQITALDSPLGRSLSRKNPDRV